jgi:hypothetical protein
MDEIFSGQCGWLLHYWVDGHQTIVAAIIVLFGVVLTLWFNAWQTRKQRREEWHHERRSMRTALITELQCGLRTAVTNWSTVAAGFSQLRAG